MGVTSFKTALLLALAFAVLRAEEDVESDALAESGAGPAYAPSAVVQYCVDVRLDPANEKDYEYCKDALLEAKNNMEVHRLLEQGHDPDRKLDFQGRTKLILATFRGQKDIVAELINFGQADVSAKASTGHTALMYAAGEGHTDLMQMFLGATSVGASVNDAVTGLFQDDGSRPPDYDPHRSMEGSTALHFACRNLKLRASAMLLDAGAATDAKDASGATPLDLAMKSPSQHVRNKFKLLFENVEALRAEAAGATATAAAGGEEAKQDEL